MKPKINFDVLIETPTHDVDMKSGLETMQGVSDATRLVAETLLSENVPLKLNYKSKVRTSLKKSFNGSYGQIFSLDVSEDLVSKMNAIGKGCFVELISYFLNESLYIEPPELSPRAKKRYDLLGEDAERLVEKLKISTLKNIHAVSTKFNYDVRFRYRHSRDVQRTLATFNEESALTLLAEELEEEKILTVAITRLNINTGNGRFLIEGDAETVAFGFSRYYRDIRLDAKKKLSHNLDANNGRDPDNYENLTVVASPIQLKDGKVVKYILRKLIIEQ